MLVPLKWLKEYVDINVSPEELAKIFNFKILEVEKVHHPGKEIKNVIVAQIKAVNKHPQADKLSLLTVFTGKEDLQIVCGAQNVAPDLKIALAQVGAELPGGMKLGKAKIRGVESFGMCCSERELGLAEEAQGILILPDDAPLGADFVKYMGLDDVVFDLAILPNRGDLQSLRSLAIEIHAATGAKLKLPEINKNVQVAKEKKADITIKDPELCGRYMGAVLKIKIKPSPEWLQTRLKSIGLRPINNVVDITNFVLHEVGQPLHAFDYAKLNGGKIIVRKAKKGEKFITLDQKVCELTEKMLAICDDSGPVALAGIMGGGNSAVEDKTDTILLEAAYFNPSSIRFTSKTTGIRTDSSIRFEKNVSFDGVEDGFYRALKLFEELAEGVVISEIVDHAPGKPKPLVIDLYPQRVNQLLGTELKEPVMLDILTKLQFGVTKNGDHYKVTVPSSRVHDVCRPIDLVEEIARLVGYDQIPNQSLGLTVEKRADTTKDQVELIVKNILFSAGFSETMSYSMTSPDIYKKIGLNISFKDEVAITNPLSVEESVMRQSLLPQLIKGLEFNNSQQISDVALFEIGKTYTKHAETWKVAGICSGNVESGILDRSIQLAVDFYFCKGILENILELCGIPQGKLERSSSPYVHPGKSIAIAAFGDMGELSPILANKLGLLQPAYVFELDLDKLIKSVNFKKVFQAIPVYPAASRDIAFLIDKKISAAEVEQVIRTAAQDVAEIKIFDRYCGEKIPVDKVSLAYSITYRSKDRTLTDQEIISNHEKIKNALVSHLKVTVR